MVHMAAYHRRNTRDNSHDSDLCCSPDTYAESFGRDISPSLLNTTDLYGLTASCIHVLRFMEAANLSTGCQPSNEACCQGSSRREMPHGTPYQCSCVCWDALYKFWR